MKQEYEDIIGHYGEEKQMHKAVEEFLELATVVQQDANKGKRHRQKVLEEIADAEHMIAQLKIIYELEESELDTMKEFKITRTMERMKRSRMHSIGFLRR